MRLTSFSSLDQMIFLILSKISVDKKKSSYQESKLSKTTRGRISREQINTHREDLDFKDKIKNPKNEK